MSSERPNRFILNTDYMSLAQASNHQFNVTLPPGTSGDNYIGTTSRDIRLPAVKGAIPRYLVSIETGILEPDNQTITKKVITVPSQGIFWIYSEQVWPSWLVTISRKDKDTISFYAMVETWDPNENFPSLTFKLRISYMYPPNI